MARAIAANTRVAYVAEATENVTPATPAFQIVPVTGESLAVERSHVFSSELNGKRGEKNYAISRAMGSGGFECEWRDGVFETILESVLRNAWAADVLTDANTPKSFTLETTFETGATDIFKRLTAAHASTFGLNLRAGEVATCSFGFMSRGGDFANAGIAGATYTAATEAPILVGADFGALALSGLTVGCLSALTVNINNNLTSEMCLGSLSPTSVSAGKLEATGTLAVFLDSDEYDVLRAYADGTATSLEFELGRTAGAKVAFNFPNIVLSDMQVAAESADGSVLMTMNWRALQATSLGGAVVELTRNV